MSGQVTIRPIDSKGDLKKFVAILRDAWHLVEVEVKKKKKLEQIQAAKVLAKYEAICKSSITPEVFVEIIYKELTHQQNEFIPH